MANKGLLAGVAIAAAAVAGAAVVILKKDVIFPPDQPEPVPGTEPTPDPGPGPDPTPDPETILINSLSINPKSGNEPLTVGFVLKVIGVPQVIEWNYGDGQVEIGSFSKTHTYFSSGTFNGFVTVTNKDGITDSRSFKITVNEPTPDPGPGPTPTDIITSFFQGKATVIQNQSIAFAISVNRPFSEIKEIRWRWGDGTPDTVGKTSSLLSVDHTYSKSGSFNGSVTVKLNDGSSEGQSFFVTVQGDPTSNISGKIILSGFFGTTIEVGEQFRAFIDRSGGVPPYIYKMDYGDGTILFQQDSFHSYAVGGNFTLRATVTDSAGNQFTATKLLTVKTRPLQIGDVLFAPAPGTTNIQPFRAEPTNTPNIRLFFTTWVRNFRDDISVSVKATAIIKRLSTGKTIVTKDSTTIFIPKGGIQQLSGFIVEYDPFQGPYQLTLDLDDASGQIIKDLDLIVGIF